MVILWYLIQMQQWCSPPQLPRYGKRNYEEKINVEMNVLVGFRALGKMV